MKEIEWLENVEGCTPGPWQLELAPTRNVFKFLWYCWRCWTLTDKNLRTQWGVISATDYDHERVIVALLGPGQHTLENGLLISGAPVMLEEKLK